VAELLKEERAVTELVMWKKHR